MKGAILLRGDIIGLLSSEPPLVEGVGKLDEQIQPNGIDLTVRDVAMVASPGTVGTGSESRILSDLSPLTFDGHGMIHLLPGCYVVTYNEIVHLPKDLMALGLPRSSLLRCGVSVHTAVWDAGYSGRSQSLMVVYNPHGFRLQKNARIVQLVFFRLTGEVAKGYQGVFQEENI